MAVRLGRSRRGFTIAELAVALVIVALLLASALIPLSAQIELKSVADTQRSMDQIRDALIGFSLANGRLPCPADGTLADGNALAGTESKTVAGTACLIETGVLPWAVLGVPETDAWGRRFTYRVAPIFADAYSAFTWYTTSPATQSNSTFCNPPSPLPTDPTSFALCSLGNMSVYTRAESNHATSAYAQNVAAVVVSHGKNGYGARTTSGAQVVTPAAGTDEAINVAGGTTTTVVTTPLTHVFISRFPTKETTACSDTTLTSAFCEFDDVVTWISSSLLMSRMVSAGRLP